MKKMLLPTLALLASCASPPPPAPQSGTQPRFTQQGLKAPQGLLGKYFKLDAHGATVFDRLQIDHRLDRIWGVNAAMRTPSATWNARLTSPSAGTYTFYLTANGFTELTINGQQVAVHPGQPGGEVSGTWNFTQPDEKVDLVVKYTNWSQPPNQLRLEWTGPSGKRQVIPAKFLTPVDLTADCLKQPAQGCLAKMFIPPYISGVQAMAPATINASFSVDNLSEIYPLHLRVHSADFPTVNGDYVVEPNAYIPIGFTFACEHAAFKQGVVTVTRIEDGRSMNADFTLNCMEIVGPPTN